MQRLEKNSSLIPSSIIRFSTWNCGCGVPGDRKDSSGPYPAALEELFLALCSKDHMLCWGFELGWATCKTSAISPVQDKLSSPKRTFFPPDLKRTRAWGWLKEGWKVCRALGAITGYRSAWSPKGKACASPSSKRKLKSPIPLQNTQDSSASASSQRSLTSVKHICLQIVLDTKT